jgi:hypothetical protein
MRMSWLIVLALLVAGLATLFATTMTRLARLNPDAQTQVVGSPASTAAAPVAPATDAGPGRAVTAPGDSASPPEAPVARAAPAGSQTTAPPDAETASAVAPTPGGGTTADRATSTTQPAAAPVSRPLVVPPALPPVAVDARQPARAAAAAREPGGTAAAPADPRSARCRSLADYLRDLDAEGARTTDVGRQVWLTEQRNTVRERQAELGC